jgi:hypothetical protein
MPDQVRHDEVDRFRANRTDPSFFPLSRPDGRGGAQAEGLGGEGLADSAVQTLTSHRFAAGPSSPAESGRGVSRRYTERRGHTRPSAERAGRLGSALLSWNRHPGLDPGSTFFTSLPRKEKGGCRIESGMTRWTASVRTGQTLAFFPSPVLTGEEGPKPKAWEVRVLLSQCYRPSPPTASRRAPPLPRKAGEGFHAATPSDEDIRGHLRSARGG